MNTYGEILGIKVIAIPGKKSSEGEFEIIFTNPEFPDRPMGLTGKKASDLIERILGGLEDAEEWYCYRSN